MTAKYIIKSCGLIRQVEFEEIDYEDLDTDKFCLGCGSQSCEGCDLIALIMLIDEEVKND